VASNRFSSNKPVRKTADEKENQHSHLFDFLHRTPQDILHDYNTNPFFRAKLNYLLKTTPGLTHCLPYEHRLDLPLQTYKHCTRTANQEF
jgi:hypothetical protein